MHFSSSTIAAAAALTVTGTTAGSVGNVFSKRDDITWGPVVYLGPSTSEIVSVVATTYPGEMPSSQAGGLFVWSGVTNNTGDLVQSIIGSYEAGQSECSGTDADSNWCISSEVYGLDDTGATTQFVGDLTTLDSTVSNGLLFNYTLIDSTKYTWLQTVHDAATGTLMSKYSKDSGPMNNYNTAVECQKCTGTISEQTWVNTTIVLASADANFGSTLYTTEGATVTDMATPDNGVTWTIGKMVIPAMDSSSSSSSTSSTSTTAASASTTTDDTSKSPASSPVATSSTTTAPTSSDGPSLGGFGSMFGGPFGMPFRA